MVVSSANKRYPPAIRIYFLSLKTIQRVLQLQYSIVMTCFTGVCLGLLKRDYLHQIDEAYYDNTGMYQSDAYDKQGLWNWERAVIDRYFRECRKLLVIGVGGGREFLELHKSGYDVDGFECNPKLVEYANSLLESEGIDPTIQVSPRDTCRYGSGEYDGVIIGWAAYMLIQGKEQRIALLSNLRDQLGENAPLLLSFFSRANSERRFKVAARIGNTIRWTLRRELLDLGDYLSPNYVHYFTREQIAAELSAASFQLELYSTESYGHAVGISRG